MSGIQNAVEDINEDVDRLSVHNEAEGTDPDHVLPIDLVFAIKEPCYKISVDGGYCVRVDHPSDLIRLRSTDELFSKQFLLGVQALSKSATKCKNDGNAAYKRMEYIKA